MGSYIRLQPIANSNWNCKKCGWALLPFGHIKGYHNDCAQALIEHLTYSGIIMKIQELFESQTQELSPDKYYVVKTLGDQVTLLKKGLTSIEKAEEHQDDFRNLEAEYDDIFFASGEELAKQFPKMFSVGKQKQKKLKAGKFYTIVFWARHGSKFKVPQEVTAKTEKAAKEHFDRMKTQKYLDGVWPGAKTSDVHMGSGAELAKKFPEWFIAA